MIIKNSKGDDMFEKPYEYTDCLGNKEIGTICGISRCKRYFIIGFNSMFGCITSFNLERAAYSRGFMTYAMAKIEKLD